MVKLPINCVCGLPVETEFGGCVEFYGGTWQDVSISCEGMCGYSVDITFNADDGGQADIAEALAIDAWDRQVAAISLAKSSKRE